MATVCKQHATGALETNEFTRICNPTTLQWPFGMSKSHTRPYRCCSKFLTTKLVKLCVMTTSF